MAPVAPYKAQITKHEKKSEEFIARMEEILQDDLSFPREDSELDNYLTEQGRRLSDADVRRLETAAQGMKDKLAKLEAVSEQAEDESIESYTETALDFIMRVEELVADAKWHIDQVKQRREELETGRQQLNATIRKIRSACHKAIPVDFKLGKLRTMEQGVDEFHGTAATERDSTNAKVVGNSGMITKRTGYCVRFSDKDDETKEQSPPIYNIAAVRLRSSFKTYARDEKVLKECQKTTDDQLQKGVIEEADLDTDEPSNETTKLRSVHDGSHHHKDKPSRNETLNTGQDEQHRNEIKPNMLNIHKKTKQTFEEIHMSLREHSPWKGAFYERLIQSIKHSYAKAVGRRILNLDDFTTVMIEIEGTLNSRPLAYQSTDIDDFESIRPIDFVQRSVMLTPNMETIASDTDEDDYRPAHERNRFQSRNQAFDALRKSTNIVEQFWKKWSELYLINLRDYYALRQGKTTNREPEQGEIVLLIEDELPRNAWMLGLIEAVIRGKDDSVREVKLRLPSGSIVNRSVNTIAPTEIRSVDTNAARTDDRD
ncbi:hypothetical protein QR680_016179 [Steinernema hermaphroditum]|uniref:DUF5641 domain-containing protein n=1 Tax=Steinernema hermaphroditum TaxID=289476 RepID=A0AA39HBE8_9BILA|nr:hypothetical protein QR680_016179 [Steinernema hermaphroditum]